RRAGLSLEQVAGRFEPISRGPMADWERAGRSLGASLPARRGGLVGRCPERELRAIRGACLAEQGRDLVLDGAWGGAEQLRDLQVGEPPGQHTKDFALARREPRDDR